MKISTALHSLSDEEHDAHAMHQRIVYNETWWLRVPRLQMQPTFTARKLDVVHCNAVMSI